MTPFWPITEADPPDDPPRRPWDEHGPQEQAKTLRAGIGDELFAFLEQLEGETP